MNNIYNTISDLDVPVGHTERINCPVCKGYKTFTVTNNMGSLVWNCYKASCTASGGTRVKLSADDIRKGFSGAEEFADEPFNLPTYIVPHRNLREITEWCAKWGIDETELGIMHDVKENRIVFPVIHDGKMVDATGRSLGNRLPKWKRYGNSSLPYTHGCGKVAVVVEDCVSASVVGSLESFVGVAVLGTSLSEAHKRFLTQFSTAIIALDPDALPKTLGMAKELKGFVSNVKVLRLTDDLKYRNQQDITNLTNMIGD